MMDSSTSTPWWNIELETKPDFDQSMKRIYAWFEQQVIDRPPVRFSRHNADYENIDGEWRPQWKGQKDRWYDVDYQMEKALAAIRQTHFLGETFPIYWPNLGPNVFAGMYGSPMAFGEVTSWAEPIIQDYADFPRINWEHEYFHKLNELTQAALQLAPGQFIVGYTDIHPGIDWLAALRGIESLCLDLIDRPDDVLVGLSGVTADFLKFYDHFDNLLKAHQQLSVSWMDIPSFGRMHIPSCDIATMVSKKQFEKFILPNLLQEVAVMTHNVFHVDGRGVARHLDRILELPNLHAIQWVQGVGDDLPILQWIPLIQRIQSTGKSVVVDLTPQELEPFMAAVRPEGILLCIATNDQEEEERILKRLTQWTRP
jgi:hypothetical protein